MKMDQVKGGGLIWIDSREEWKLGFTLNKKHEYIEYLWALF